ncbi:MAG: hypothetical protein EU529_09445 [Promethearchaeota archaeon]|nr:MAG: hypothetical protein EU529_09445 [Candidatus Lokiarchaeota archaeon]
MNCCCECGSEVRESDQRFCENCGKELDSIGGTERSEGYPQAGSLFVNQYIQYGTQSNLFVINSQKKSKGSNKPNKRRQVIVIIYLIFLSFFILNYFLTYVFY